MNPDDVKKWIDVLDAVTNRPLLLLIIYVIWQNRQAIVARVWDEHDKLVASLREELKQSREREERLIDKLYTPERIP